MGKEITGACRFCRQIKITDLPEEEWLARIMATDRPANDIADDIVTMQCDCGAGESWRKEQKMIEECRQNIEDMFRENLPEIADSFQEIVSLVWARKIKKIAITIPEDGNAIMYRSGANLELKFIKKVETRLTVSEK